MVYPMGHQGLIMRLRSPRSCMRKTKILCLPRSRCVFFSLSFFGSLGTMAGLGGWGWFDKPCLDRTVDPCGLKGEAPFNVVKWRTPCHGFANPLGWPKDDRFHVWLDMISRWNPTMCSNYQGWLGYHRRFDRSWARGQPVNELDVGMQSYIQPLNGVKCTFESPRWKMETPILENQKAKDVLGMVTWLRKFQIRWVLRAAMFFFYKNFTTRRCQIFLLISWIFLGRYATFAWSKALPSDRVGLAVGAWWVGSLAHHRWTGWRQVQHCQIFSYYGWQRSGGGPLRS